jgi:hypothetical protein
VKSNFDEELYKFFLTREIVHSGEVDFPSRNNENISGIDAMMLSYNQDFWGLFGRLRTGLIVENELWDGIQQNIDGIQHDIDKIEIKSKFHANVFLQFKVPDFITTSNGTEYGLWNQSYYRYKINKNQNNSLSVLENKVGSTALVAYACPATNKYDMLKQYDNNNSVAINSNFARPSEFVGHSAYTFIAADLDGKAHSKISEIKPLKLFDEIKKLDSSESFENNSDFILNLASMMNSTVHESDKLTQTKFRDILNSLGEIENKFGQSLATIFSFLLIHNLTWYVVKS